MDRKSSRFTSPNGTCVVDLPSLCLLAHRVELAVAQRVILRADAVRNKSLIVLNHELRPILPIVASVTLSACAHLGTSPSLSREQCAAPITSGVSVEAVRRQEEAGAASNVTGWPRERGERMFGPGYVAVGQDGSVRTRDVLLANWRSQPWASRFDIKELEIQVYCDMATAVGLAEALPIGASEGTKPAHFRWLNVWTQEDGVWRLAATQFALF